MELSRHAKSLAAPGWLATTPRTFRDAVLSRAELREVPRAQAIYRSGDPPGRALGSGVGRGRGRGRPGRSRLAARPFRRPGYWIGAGPLSPGSRGGSGWSRPGRSVLLHLPMAEFDAIAAEDPHAWRWLAMLPVQQAILATGVAEDLMIRDPRRRLWAILLRLAGRASRARLRSRGDRREPGDLAGIANLSRTAVGQMLRSFEADGLIERRYRRIRFRRTGAPEGEIGAPPSPSKAHLDAAPGIRP